MFFNLAFIAFVAASLTLLILICSPWISNLIDAYKKNRDKTLADEILPGVTKPTVILRDMLIAQIHAADFKTKYKKIYEDMLTRESLRLSHHDLIVVTYRNCTDPYNTIRLDGDHPLNRVEVEGLYMAFHKAKERFKEQEEIDAEAERQKKALKQIEKLLGIGGNNG